MGLDDFSAGGRTPPARLGDIEAIDSKLRSVATLRRAALAAGSPAPSMEVVDALLDERLRAQRGYKPRPPDLRRHAAA